MHWFLITKKKFYFKIEKHETGRNLILTFSLTYKQLHFNEAGS